MTEAPAQKNFAGGFAQCDIHEAYNAIDSQKQSKKQTEPVTIRASLLRNMEHMCQQNKSAQAIIDYKFWNPEEDVTEQRGAA